VVATLVLRMIVLTLFLATIGRHAQARTRAETLETNAPSILLVTLDTVRADRIGAYGYASATTPTLDRLAKQGVLFESAVSPTPITLPSHVSILTGTYPSAHGVRDNGAFALRRRATLISEVLHQHGFRTAAFVGTYILDERFGLNQGFETYTGPTSTTEFRMHAARRPANDVVDDAISWFEHLDPDERFFAWVHFYDAHRPLAESDPNRLHIEHPYDAAITFCDRQLGRLLEFLEKREQSKNLLIVVTADHGESNGEHGEETHGIFLYQSVMRVPLIFAGGPLAQHKGVRVSRAVTNTAIAPTLLSLAGLPPEEMPAVQLGPLFPAKPGNDISVAVEPLLLESLAPYYSYRWHALQGVMWNSHKLIRGSTSELYALEDDPNELVDVADENPELVADLEHRLDRLIARHQPLDWAKDREIPENELDLLAALGYGVHRAGADPFSRTLPDPRERIGDIELINEISDNYVRWIEVSEKYPTAWQRDQHGRHFLDKARTLALELRTRNPADPTIPVLLGAVESELRNYDAAIPLLERSVRDRPLESDRHARLGDTYSRANRLDDAIREMQVAIDLDPEQPAYHQRLITYLLEAQRIDEALQSMDRYVAAMKVGSPERRVATTLVSNQKQAIRAAKERSESNATGRADHVAQ